MARTTITAAQVDANSPGDETLFGSLRGNDIDHETRILAIENQPNIIAYSHFNQRHFYGDNTAASPDNVLLTTGGVDGLYELKTWPEPFYLAIDAQASGGTWNVATIVNRIGVTADEHFLRFTPPSADSAGTRYVSMLCMSRHSFIFNTATKPIVFEARIRLAVAASKGFRVGLIPRLRMDGYPSTTLTAGIFMQRNGANWEFVRGTGGAFTAGSSITPPADNTWAKVKIEYDTTPGTQARCYLKKSTDSDYVLIDTFTTSLPAADQLHGACIIGTSGNHEITTTDLDYLKVYASGAVAEAA